MWEMSCLRFSVYVLAWKHFVRYVLFVRRDYIELVKLGDYYSDRTQV